MKKQKKHSNITIFLTKRNLLFWKWEIFFIYNIMVSLLFLLIPAGGLFAAMIQGDLAAVLIRLDKDFWLMLFSGMGFSIIFPDICYFVSILHRLSWLQREELYLGVSFNECFKQTEIHRRDVIYADSDWFIIPNRAYVFHIHFIKELGKFSGNGRYRTGLIETANDGKWKIVLTAGEVKKLRQWYRMQKSNAATADNTRFSQANS